MGRKPRRATPVSYTHLDVYKRQGFDGCNGVMAFAANQRDEVRDLQDVYKRQSSGMDS